MSDERRICEKCGVKASEVMAYACTDGHFHKWSEQPAPTRCHCGTVCGNPSCFEPATGAGPWRQGRKVGRTLYFGDILVGMVDTHNLAAAICAAMNKEKGCAGDG